MKHRITIILAGVVLAGLLGTAVAGGTPELSGGVTMLVPPAKLPDAAGLSEPHLALDPSSPSVLVAAAQTSRAVVAWRSVDGGRSCPDR